MDNQECSNCKYWEPLVYVNRENQPPVMKDGHRVGWCKKYAPKESERWPETEGFQFCGEWEAKVTELDKLRIDSDYYKLLSRCRKFEVKRLKAKERDFRKWLLKIALPLNGCTKHSTTKTLIKVIEKHMNIKA